MNIKRQVRRNARESKQARERRLSNDRAQRYWANAPAMCDIHYATASEFLACDAAVMRNVFLRSILGGGPTFISWAT